MMRRYSRTLGDAAMRSRVDGLTDPAQAKPLQEADPDQTADRSEVNTTPREHGPVPHRPPPVVGVDVWRDDACGLVEVPPGTRSGENEQVTNSGQDCSSHTDQCGPSVRACLGPR